MAKTVNQGFEEFLDKVTPTTRQREAAASHRGEVKAALEKALTVNRFFETGSFSHGTGVRNHSDVDVLASIAGNKPGSSDTALRWVKDALSARFPTTTVRVSRPAVVVDFAGGSEAWEVIPGFLTCLGPSKELIYEIPGPSTGWIDTAPDEHLKYVNDSNQNPKVGNAKALARLVKAWKYYNLVPISSFYLEMRAAQHVNTQTTYVHVWDLCQLLEKLDGHELSAMNDPAGLAGRIQPCSSDAKKETALSKLSTAATRARKALDASQANNADSAFYYLNLLFGGKFPSR